MKRVLSKSLAKVLAVVMVLSLSLSGGLPVLEAEANNFITITTAAEVNAIRNNLSGNYRLGADINLSAYPQWIEIGTSLHKSFRGTLDGAGYTISGLSFGGRAKTDYGLFGYTNGATIKDLNIILAGGTSTSIACTRKGVVAGSLYNSVVDNVHIDGRNGTVQGGDYSGGIAGVLNGSTITNSSVKDLNIITKCAYAGGVIGVSYSDACGSNKPVLLEGNTVTNVRVSAGSDHAGGFVGYTYDPGSNGLNIFRDNHVTDAVVTAKCSYVGGFVGKAFQSHLFENNSASNITATSSKMYYAGGFLGHAYGPENQNTTMIDCHVFGATVKAGNIAGGFAGMLGLTTSHSLSIARGCYAIDVDVQTTEKGCGFYAGGWAGKIFRANVSESCATGTLVRANSTSTGWCVGGFVGEMAYDATVQNCYAEFDSVSGMKWVGGFVGYLSGAGTNTTYNTYGVARNLTASYYLPASGAYAGFASGGTLAGTNYYDSQVCSNWPGTGTNMRGHLQGYNTATMMQQATFVGWDFANVWKIEENRTYPYFWKQSTPQSDAPIINSVAEGATEVTGLGVAGATVTVTIPGAANTIDVVVGAAGSWSVTVPAGVNLVSGNVVSAVQSEAGKGLSERTERIVEGAVITDRTVTVTVSNDTTGGSSAAAGDTIKFDGFVTAGTNLWRYPEITITFATGFQFTGGEVLVNGTPMDPADYEYRASRNTLTIYMSRISALGTATFSFTGTTSVIIPDGDLASVITSVDFI